MLKAIPIELKTANDFVNRLHRHHDAVYRDKFRIGCVNDNGILIGVVQLGRPVARYLDDGKTIEVVRLCTDGTRNVCSFLYARAARIAREMGYTNRDEFEHDLADYLWDCEDGAAMTDAEFDARLKQELAKYEPYWKNCIILHANN